MPKASVLLRYGPPDVLAWSDVAILEHSNKFTSIRDHIKYPLICQF